MATIKKSKITFRPKAKAGIKLKKAQNGGEYDEDSQRPSSDEKERQFGKAPAKSQEGEGPSSDEKVRQGDRSAKDSAKTPPNKFTPVTPPASAPEKKQSFGDAFKAARAAKKGTFEWNGKKYTSETKEEAAKKSTPASKPAAPSNEGPLRSKQNAEGPLRSKQNSSAPSSSFSTKIPTGPSRPAYKRPGKDVEGDGKGPLRSKANPAFSTKPNIPGMKKGGTVKKKMKTGGKIANGPVGKKFAALAAPKNKITFADKIAGAKKVVKAVSKKK